MSCPGRSGSGGLPRGTRRPSCAFVSAALTPPQGQTLCGSGSIERESAREPQQEYMDGGSRAGELSKFND